MIYGPVSIIGLNCVYWVIYRSEIPWIEQFKVNKTEPWPWKKGEGTPEGEENARQWRKFIIKSIKNIVFNGVISNFVLMVSLAWMYNW